MNEKGHLSNNHRIYLNIQRKLRHAESSPDLAYILIFSFLYKYCSDSLKEYFLYSIEDKEITLDEAYNDEDEKWEFRNDARHMFGYFIDSPDAFIDEVVNTRFSSEYFVQDFIYTFTNHITFPEHSQYQRYFDFIFNSVIGDVNIHRFDIENEDNLIIKDIIRSISRLDINESELEFSKVFDLICESRFIQINSAPDYINQLLIRIASKLKSEPDTIYNPFLDGGSSVIDFAYHYDFGPKRIYGKCADKITYCASLVKLFISFIDLNSVVYEYGDAMESVDIDGQSFDVIMSNLSNVSRFTSRMRNQAQNIELSKRNRKREIGDAIARKLNMDVKSLESDPKLNSALETLASKIDYESSLSFTGEYASLRHSEYLYIINLIDSLKRDGIMVVSLPQSFLFKNSLETLRKYLTLEYSCIDSVISVPDVLSSTRRPEIICVFKAGKTDSDVLFVDLSQDFDYVQTKRRPGRIRQRIKWNEKSIKKLVDVVASRKSIEGYSSLVGIDEIIKNEFNLSVSRYVDTFEGEFIKLSDLKDEKKQITSNIKRLNIRIDEMMDELNLKF